VSAFKSPRATFTVASSGLQAILAGPWTDHAANRAEPNFRYVFEASADLAQWTKLAVRTNLTGGWGIRINVFKLPGTLKVVAADADEDAVLECAVVGQAQFLVSGDRHLFALGNYQGIQIAKAVDFLILLQSATKA
jgi:hypothetical protein